MGTDRQKNGLVGNGSTDVKCMGWCERFYFHSIIIWAFTAQHGHVFETSFHHIELGPQLQDRPTGAYLFVTLNAVATEIVFLLACLF